MLGQRTKLCQLIRILPIQQRQQTNVAVNLAETDRSTENSGEWEQARPYSQIPKIPVTTFLRNYLPGGKYYKLEFPDALLNMIEEHGPLVRLPSVFGKPELLVTHDPKHFEIVLRNEGIWPERFGSDVLHHHRHEHRKDFYNGTEGIVATQGETWAKFRTSVNPVLMQPKTVRLYYKKMSNVNKEFIQRIRDIRDSNTLEVPASFEEDINRWTLESVSVVALDKQLGLIHTNRDDPQAKILFDNLTKFFELSGIIEFQPSLWRYIATPTYKKMMKVMDNIQEITVGYVNEALERLEREPSDKPESDQSVLEKLAKIDKKVATVMAMDMLMAGVDTTTTTFTGCLLCLAKNPEKQAKLREEILRILPEKDSEFTEASMKNVPYLRACIKEALRVYPLAPGNARVIKSDIVLNGYQVPKETPVLMLNHGIEKDDQHFPRSKEFLPERWLREETSASKCPNSLKPSNPFAYLPFGFGPRMCIGRRIVDMELELGIARLLRNFHVEYNYSTEKAFKCTILNVPNIPLTFKFTDVEQ